MLSALVNVCHPKVLKEQQRSQTPLDYAFVEQLPSKHVRAIKLKGTPLGCPLIGVILPLAQVSSQSVYESNESQSTGVPPPPRVQLAGSLTNLNLAGTGVRGKLPEDLYKVGR